MKKIIAIAVILCVFAMGSSASAFQPSMRINGLSALTLAQREIAFITVSLYIGTLTGNLDYFLVAYAASGWYHYNVALATWRPGIAVTYQGPATTLTDYPVTSLSDLPTGNYDLYFGVDSQDGELNTSDPYFYYGSANLKIF